MKMPSTARPRRDRVELFPLSAIAIALALAGCGSSGSGGQGAGGTDSTPTFDPSLFDADSATIENRFLPLAAGTTSILEGQDDEGEMIRVVTTVSHQTREVAGVEAAIVVDREYEGGELIEETFDWFAEDRDGNVWYLGEASTEYEDGVAVSTDGSWETGVDVEGVGVPGQASVIMFENPIVGMNYAQEIYQGVAEDRAEIVSLDAAVTLADGTSASALQVLETNPLEPDSVDEYKYYVAGVGLVLERKVDDSEMLQLTETLDQRTPNIDPAAFSASTRIDHPFHPLVPGTVRRYAVQTEDGLEEILIEVLAETRTVMGIENVVVRDRVFLDGVLIEDTFDWFSQDDAGNVWYFGEEVVNYEYDDEGTLLSTNDDGSWEAGVDNAQPGVQMPANVRVGDSYRQEYRAGIAEDVAAVIALDEPVTLGDGREFLTIQTLEWNPLEEDSFEYKFFGEGVGLVREQDIEGEEVVDLVQ